MLPIKGLEKMSLIDYPPNASAVVFLGGCNFRCAYCQNPDLVVGADKIPTIPEQEVLDFLATRRGWLDAVVITGGEPMLYDLIPFLRRIKEQKLQVKLDTNGTNPEQLSRIIDEKLADYIAMDIKAPLGMYSHAVDADVDVANIRKSAELLMKGGVDYEFRTTVVPDLFTDEDAHEIGEWLSGAKRYALQQYRKDIKVLNPKYQKTYPKEKLFELQGILHKYIDEVVVRGVPGLKLASPSKQTE
jgi:pyruvate formate lyase activating enzyme